MSQVCGSEYRFKIIQLRSAQEAGHDLRPEADGIYAIKKMEGTFMLRLVVICMVGAIGGALAFPVKVQARDCVLRPNCGAEFHRVRCARLGSCNISATLFATNACLRWKCLSK